ncbi:GNAT family N-acetyltransferase [Duganella sp. sic0402]|uniref:GNAT family N-acetyltransferase n=1 Tax=Duganella sp. sic0402 TaxID=2854786 RepID=UPI001C47CAF5|nr:GNAT family N-acetyltransferase [Duganella sp. sic0402]MBV7536381.1 GNAT family N-acetyltransferase [Duganella sp. sic0402]
MSNFLPFQLQTNRLTLRFVQNDDAKAMFDVHSDPQAMRYFSSTEWQHLDQAVEHIQKTLAGYADGSALRLAMVLRDGQNAGAVIGSVTLYAFDQRNHRCEMGYILGRPYWGQRYTQEALRALIAHAFGPLELRRLEADIHPDNIASERLLQSLHFQREGHLRERWFVGDEVSDSIIYGLLRRDWEAAIHPAQ